MAWYEIDFAVDEHLPEIAGRLTDEFDALFLAAGCPKGMALFVTRASDERVAFYMSPAAAHYAHDLIEQFAGRACQPPRAPLVELVDGYEHDGQRLCPP